MFENVRDKVTFLWLKSLELIERVPVWWSFTALSYFEHRRLWFQHMSQERDYRGDSFGHTMIKSNNETKKSNQKKKKKNSQSSIFYGKSTISHLRRLGLTWVGWWGLGWLYDFTPPSSAVEGPVVDVVSEGPSFSRVLPLELRTKSQAMVVTGRYWTYSLTWRD